MIKVGIIGAGAIAQIAHIPSYQKMDKVEIVAICDINEKKAQTVAKKFGIKSYFTNYKDLLNLSQIKAVSICTPNYFHQKQVVDSLRAGKHVLCEKPLCLNVKEIKDIFKEVKRGRDKICMIAYMFRFMNISQKLKKFIDAGELGRIYYAKASFLRKRGAPLAGSWFTAKKMSGGGSLIDIGVHILDLSLWLMGNPAPLSVSGSVYSTFREKGFSGGWPPPHTLVGNRANYGFDVEDMANGFIKFSNGASLFLEVSWAGNSEAGGNLSFFGTKGGAKISFYEDEPSHKELKIFKGKEKEVVEIVPSFAQKDDVYYKEIKHFVECIREGKKPLTSFEETLTLGKIIEAIYKSAEEKREAKITSSG